MRKRNDLMLLGFVPNQFHNAPFVHTIAVLRWDIRRMLKEYGQFRCIDLPTHIELKRSRWFYYPHLVRVKWSYLESPFSKYSIIGIAPAQFGPFTFLAFIAIELYNESVYIRDYAKWINPARWGNGGRLRRVAWIYYSRNISN